MVITPRFLEIQQIIVEYSKSNPKLGKIFSDALEDICKNKEKYIGKGFNTVAMIDLDHRLFLMEKYSIDKTNER